jgi:hypothetical protein
MELVIRIVTASLVVLASCAYAGVSTAPYELAAAAPHPGACGWLRVDADGNRRRTERTWAGDRILVEITYDESDEPRLIRSRRFVYDAHGRRVGVQEVDGAEQRAATMTYDARGRWVATEAEGRREERFYDDDGRVTARRVVSTRDGRVLQVHTLKRDEAGELVSERIEFPTEGRSETIALARDDQAGVVERWTTRTPPDALEQRDVYTFTPSGHLATMVRHGDVRLTQHYRRDDDGNLLRVDTWDADGDPIAATVYDYGCWSG